MTKEYTVSIDVVDEYSHDVQRGFRTKEDAEKALVGYVDAINSGAFIKTLEGDFYNPKYVLSIFITEV